jgi:hypothetical protein
MPYDIASYKAVMALLGKGLSDYKTAQRTGVTRGTDQLPDRYHRGTTGE